MTKLDKRRTVRAADFSDHLRQRLDEQSPPLAPEVLQALHKARIDALAQSERTVKSSRQSTFWKPVTRFATAAVLVLTVIYFNDLLPSSQSSDVDTELLFSDEGFQFYEDLEFYRWLANNDL